MEDFLQQIEKSLDCNLYYLALQSVLTLPDICGALMSSNGENNKNKYIDWYNSYFLDNNCSLSAEDCYNFRCSNLHQGKTSNRKSKYSRILFLEPQTSTITMNNCIFDDALCIDLNIFCRTMIDSVRIWFKSVKDNPTFQNNYTTFIKRYPHGLSPYIVGTPVIS